MVDAAVIIAWVGFVLLLPLLALAEHRTERTKGRILRYHLYYAGVALAGILLVPSSMRYAIYSPLGVIIIGTVFPIYESIRAVCTPGGEDDKSWLMVRTLLYLLLLARSNNMIVVEVSKTKSCSF